MVLCRLLILSYSGYVITFYVICPSDLHGYIKFIFSLILKLRYSELNTFLKLTLQQIIFTESNNC